MLPELSIERVFRREIDTLPVPPERSWVPTERGAHSVALSAAVIAGAALLVIAAVSSVLDVSDAASAQRPRLIGFPPNALPRCTPPATQTPSGRCVAPVPIAYRNQAYGYNLVIPGEWHDVQIQIPPQRAGGLLDRQVFTGRAASDWLMVTDTTAAAWDLDVQVWDRRGLSATEWSYTLGPCDHAVVSFGGHCQSTTGRVGGVDAIITTVGVGGNPAYTVSYYIERGDRILILRYVINTNAAPPAGVNEETLQRIVASLGLD